MKITKFNIFYFGMGEGFKVRAECLNQSCSSGALNEVEHRAMRVLL